MTAERARIALVTAAALGMFVAGVGSLLQREESHEFFGDPESIESTDDTYGFDDTLDERTPQPPTCFERADRAACLQVELEDQAAAYIAGEQSYRPTGVYRAAR